MPDEGQTEAAAFTPADAVRHLREVYAKLYTSKGLSVHAIIARQLFDDLANWLNSGRVGPAKIRSVEELVKIAENRFAEAETQQTVIGNDVSQALRRVSINLLN